MPRTKHTTRPDRKPDAVLTGDWHLRLDAPRCREQGEWLRCMEAGMKQVAAEGVPVLHSGDLFDRADPPYALLHHCLVHLPPLFLAPGNHDLPRHTMKNLHRSAVGLLQQADKLHIRPSVSQHGWESRFYIYFLPWGEQPPEHYGIPRGADRSILVYHHGVVRDRPKAPGEPESTAEDLLKQFPMFDLIVTGHYHEPFKVERGGRMVLNVGSLFRVRVTEDHRPRYWRWWCKENVVEPVFVDKGVLITERVPLDNGAQQARITQFIRRVKTQVLARKGFEEGMEDWLTQAHVSRRVRTKIRQAVEEVQDVK